MYNQTLWLMITNTVLMLLPPHKDNDKAHNAGHNVARSST